MAIGISPTKFRRAARPGETLIQNFTVRPVPNGTIRATVMSDSPLIRLRSLTAAEEIRTRLTDEEFAQLPRELQDEKHRFSIETVFLASVQAGEPLAVTPALSVMGEVEFVAAAEAGPNSFVGMLVLEASSGERIEAPIVFIIGELGVRFLDDPVTALRGVEVSVPVQFTLPSGVAATELKLDSAEPFMRVAPTTVVVPEDGSATAVVRLFTDAVTPLGPHTTNLRIDGFSGLATNFPFDTVVADPFRAFLSITPESLTALPGSELELQLQVVAQGGPIEVAVGHLPVGVRMVPPVFSVAAGSASQLLRARLVIDADAPVGNRMWVPLMWRSLDGQATGFANTLLTVQLPPESRTFRHQVVTPTGTALGGFVEITIRNDGTYTFNGHLHDSGFDSYDFRLNVVVRTSPDEFISLAEFKSGSVHGSVGSGSRNFDWQDELSNDMVRHQWTSFRDGRAEFTFDFENTGALGTLVDVAKAAAELIVTRVFLGPVVAPLIMIGSRIAASANLPISSPPGIPGAIVLGGAVLLIGPLGIFPAFLAGVAIASLADIKSRPLNAEERELAFSVFRDTLPIDRIRVTNLSGKNADGRPRAFTHLHTVDRSIILGVGERGFSSDLSDLDLNTTLIHELTHAWQFVHSGFSAAELMDQIRKPFETQEEEFARYSIDPHDGRPWSSYNTEQQAVVVATWFADREAHPAHPEDALRSDLFPYVQNHIRQAHD